MTTRRPCQTHHLFIERAESTPKGAAAHSSSVTLEVSKDKLTYLQTKETGAPQLVDSHDAQSAGVALQTIRHGGRLCLLLMAARNANVRINGLPAAPVNTLEVGDVLDFDSLQLHVSVFNSPYVGPPLAEHLGVECGYCRLKIADTPKMRIYVCPACGQPMHCQDKDVPADQRLECAELASTCRHCEMNIVAEGYANVPHL